MSPLAILTSVLCVAAFVLVGTLRTLLGQLSVVTMLVQLLTVVTLTGCGGGGDAAGPEVPTPTGPCEANREVCK